MPHSKPSATSRASSLNRLSWAIGVSWMTVPSRTTRTLAERRTTPFVTMHPPILPSRDNLNRARHLDPARRHIDRGAPLGRAEHLSRRDRREHPGERLLDVLRELVDHAVRADVDAL